MTQAQYAAVMSGLGDSVNANPSFFANNLNHPVEQVSYNDVLVFLERINSLGINNLPDGWEYILPTEAEWEYACRAGTSTAFSWGDEITPENANWQYSEDVNSTTAVGSYQPNAFGFFDMHGNVAEFTSDWYDSYTLAQLSDPIGPALGSHKVIRSGSWRTPVDGSYVRSAVRYKHPVEFKQNNIGFRLALRERRDDVYVPEIHFPRGDVVEHLKGTPWFHGVTAFDYHDGNLTDQISVSGLVEVNLPGNYEQTFSVVDSAGNQASKKMYIQVGTPANYVTELNATTSLELIWVGPSTFTMGQDGVATPVHEVTLSNGFYLGKYEVTQAQYEAVMTGNTETDSNGNVISATPSNWPNNPNRPVEKVSWDDIQVFLTRLNAQEAGNIPAGWAYVLPTGAVGVCLPGRHDHGVLLGRYDYFERCQL